LYLNRIFLHGDNPQSAIEALWSLTNSNSLCRNKIQILHLNLNPGLDEKALKLISGFPHLKELSLEQISISRELREAFATITASCSEIQALTAAGCEKIDDACLLLVGEKCSNLSYLDISFCNSTRVTETV